MIHATFDSPIRAEEGDSGTRTISGTAVPWDRWGRVSDGSWVRFAPGSLDAEARPIVAIGHDPSRAIGRVTANTSTEAGMETRVSVSRVRDGDEALVLAADGVLGMFSVGVDATESHYEDHGGEQGLVVTSGAWQHLALLPFGAFEDARVSSVAAAKGEPTVETSTEDAPVEAAPAVVPLTAGSALAQPPLTIGRLAHILATGTQHKLHAVDVEARIQAALTNVTTSNVPSVPNYRTELVGLIDHGTPVTSRLTPRPLPETGGDILYPEWAAFPDSTAKQLTEKTAIASGDVGWTWRSNQVETWAQGNDLSLQTVQRSNPSAMDAYLRAAAIDAGNKYEANTITALTAASVKPAGATAVFIDNVALMFGALDPTKVPSGRLWLAVSLDLMPSLIKLTGLNGPALWQASINFGSFLPEATASTLDIFVAPGLGSKKLLMGMSTGAAIYGGPQTTTDIRVVDVSLLGLDVGVYFFASLAIEYPGAFVSLTSL
jgi:phage head maturation protease